MYFSPSRYQWDPLAFDSEVIGLQEALASAQQQFPTDEDIAAQRISTERQDQMQAIGKQWHDYIQEQKMSDDERTVLMSIQVEDLLARFLGAASLPAFFRYFIRATSA